MSIFIKNIQNGINKFHSYFSIYGFKNTVSQLSKNIFLMEYFYRLEKNLALPENTCQAKIPVTVQTISGDFDLDAWKYKRCITEFRGEYGISQFKERLLNGDVLFIAAQGDELMGFAWLGFPPFINPGYKLNENEAYTYDGWTFEAYRGNGILPVIQQAAMQYLRTFCPQIQIIVTHIAEWNAASISGDKKAGYVITKKELGLVFFGYHHKFSPISNKNS